MTGVTGWRIGVWLSESCDKFERHCSTTHHLISVPISTDLINPEPPRVKRAYELSSFILRRASQISVSFCSRPPVFELPSLVLGNSRGMASERHHAAVGALRLLLALLGPPTRPGGSVARQVQSHDCFIPAIDDYESMPSQPAGKFWTPSTSGGGFLPRTSKIWCPQGLFGQLH